MILVFNETAQPHPCYPKNYSILTQHSTHIYAWYGINKLTIIFIKKTGQIVSNKEVERHRQRKRQRWIECESGRKGRPRNREKTKREWEKVHNYLGIVFRSVTLLCMNLAFCRLLPIKCVPFALNNKLVRLNGTIIIMCPMEIERATDIAIYSIFHHHQQKINKQTNERPSRAESRNEKVHTKYFVYRMRMSTNKNEHSIHYIVRMERKKLIVVSKCMHVHEWAEEEESTEMKWNTNKHNRTHTESNEAGTSERSICMSFLVKLMKNQQQWLFYTYFSVYHSLNESERASKPANGQGFERNGTIEKTRQNIKTLKRFNWNRVWVSVYSMNVA